MLKSKSLAALFFAALLAALSQAHAQSQPDPHHPDQAPGAAATAPGTQAQPGMPMPMMMDMMSNMMKMMGGGGAQMGMGGGMDNCAMMGAAHIEGRIAFLRAELVITDAQAKTWDAFADVLRANAKRVKEATMPMMANAAPPQMLGQLEQQERMLAAKLEEVKATKAAYAALHESLTPEQRKTADELLKTHMGMMPPGMMMGGGMPKQQKMQ